MRVRAPTMMLEELFATLGRSRNKRNVSSCGLKILTSFKLGCALTDATCNTHKSELDKSVDLSLSGLAPAQSQEELFFDTLCARNKQWAANFNKSEEAISRVTASAMFFQGHDNWLSWERVF